MRSIMRCPATVGQLTHELPRASAYGGDGDGGDGGVDGDRDLEGGLGEGAAESQSLRFGSGGG